MPWGPLYTMSKDKLLVLRNTLNGLLDKGFIRVSQSPAAAPVLFVRKPGGGLRFCVDYRGLNKITRKDCYPLPLIQETLNSVSKAKYFTKLDVIAVFHKIRIAEGDEWKMVFHTRYGLYEWLVTLFGLANTPSTFQKYINHALKDFLDDFCSAYIDNILIYTDGTLGEHKEQVKRVLQQLQEAGLQIDIDKCEFHAQSTKYLGFILEAGKGLRMDPEKISALQAWEAPTSVRAVQAFLGFANFYRHFIKDFSKIAAPLTGLTKKDAVFQWTPESDKAFHLLKRAFVMAPVLGQFDADRETVLARDTSGWCSGAVLQQVIDSVLRLIAYMSKRHLPAECNYEIYNKEMLTIIKVLDKWDTELRSVKEFRIVTDHRNLKYFMSTRKLTKQQMRWAKTLSKYDFKILYTPGKSNTIPDLLSHHPQDLPNRLDDRLLACDCQLLKPGMCAPGVFCPKPSSELL